jgi:hypothetical protein
MTEFGSSTDLETLRRSGRGKIVVLGVLIAGALGAAAWTFLRRGGTGNPEEAGKVLVVTRGTHVGSSIVLKDVGFETGEGTLPAWVNKAKDEVPELEVEGIEAVMELADRFGWGFVLFESPGEVDFSALEFEGGPPTIPADAKWAAVSVGDFAFPHVITFNPAPSKVLRDGTLPMLQALFEQKQLAALRKPESLAVDQLQLRDKLEEALRRLDQVPEAEKMAEKVVRDLDKALAEGERVEPKPARVGETLESLTARPLADGSVLSIGRTLEVVTRDAVRADLDLGDREQFLVGAAMAEPSARVPCTSLAEGGVAVGDWRSIQWSDDGSTALLSTLGNGDSLWTLDATKAGACAWTKLGAVERGRSGLDGPAVLGPGGAMARVGFVDGLGVISVTRPGEPEVVLGMLESTVLSQLVWIDGDHLAALADYEIDDTAWIAIFSVRDTTRVVVAPAKVAAGNAGITQLAAIPGRASLLAVGYDGRLVRIDLPAAPAALLANPPMATDVPPLVAEGRPTVYQVDAGSFTSKALTDSGNQIGDLAVSRDGKRATMTVSGNVVDPEYLNDGEIAIVDLDSGAMRVLTRNALDDDDPVFTADGRHVVFSTRVQAPKSDWTITAARIVPAE